MEMCYAAPPYRICVAPVNRKQKSKSSKRRNAENKGSQITRGVTLRNAVSPPSNRVHKIRRAFTRRFAFNPATGWDASGSNNIQMSFAPGGSEIRLGGVAIYSDTLPNYAEFSNLFDQYRIRSVTCRFDWTANIYTNTGTSNVPPLIYLVADYDDSTDAAVSALVQYPQVVTHSFITNGYTPLIFSLQPKPLRDVASTGILTGYGPMPRAPYLRTTDSTIPHYGIKIAADLQGATAATTIGYLTLTCYFDLDLVNPK